MGKVIVQELGDVAEVTSVDLVPPEPGVRWGEADLMRAEDLAAALEGHDAVVHVAALLRPEDPDDAMFQVNVLGTWNVLQGARSLGIRRMVIVSSETVSGIINITHVPQAKPDYLPIDEAHPLRPRETYGMSKRLGEVMAERFANEGDMEIVVLRPTLILMPGWEEYVMRTRAGDDPDLWSYVLVWDVAYAARLALCREVEPYSVFYISAADTFSREPTLAFMRRKFGLIGEIRNPELYSKHPHAAIWDISGARRVLGFVPRYDWRRFLNDGGYRFD